MAYNVIGEIFHAAFRTHFASAVESSLAQNRGITDVIYVIRLKVCFDPRAGNRE